MNTVRVAAVQFAAGTDPAANHAKILAMLDLAAAHEPDLVVLPEFANHASWYRDAAHCYDVAVALDGPLVADVAAKAAAHNTFVVLNVTLRREDQVCTASSILFDRQGRILAVSDKQVLMGHENDFLRKATALTPVVETEIGRIGLYACMDGVISETPRSLAVRGAQILCNSLNSFAVDEASLHVPVRAAENKVFVVAANKIGPLIPEDQLAMASAFTHIPQHFLFGAGESQIVAPDGTVLVKASLANEEVIIADIDPQQADAKLRPDGNHVFKHRRPDLYQALLQRPEPIPHAAVSRPVRVACWQGQATGEAAIAEFTAALPALDHAYELVVLPELFFVANLASLDLAAATAASAHALASIERALTGRKLHVAGSFLFAGTAQPQHCGVVVGQDGIVFRQAQLRHSARFDHVLDLGRSLETVVLPFGKVGLLVGEDAIYPELYRLLALQGADLVAISGHIQESWELATGLVERAAENRLCLAFASRPQTAGASLLADLERDFTLMTPWEERIFDGKINMPRLRLAPRSPAIVGQTLHLEQARNKVISSRTHLLDDRPWWLG